MVHNFRSKLQRLNFHGFYTVLLEKNDELITTAILRYLQSPIIVNCSLTHYNDLKILVFSLINIEFMAKRWQKFLLLLRVLIIVGVECVMF